MVSLSLCVSLRLCARVFCSAAASFTARAEKEERKDYTYEYTARKTKKYADVRQNFFFKKKSSEKKTSRERREETRDERDEREIFFFFFFFVFFFFSFELLETLLGFGRFGGTVRTHELLNREHSSLTETLQTSTCRLFFLPFVSTTENDAQKKIHK